MPALSVNSLHLYWKCDDCRHDRDTVIVQPLTDLVEVGSPLCRHCEQTMTLMDQVTTTK